ncbi:MAG: unnamed protein product [uncultured Paraburkholderia sp.]|uniref:hypothetical protein n=1 Tax=uncultured Paraburkholderia sp. TaxID=1822466 RepID=UPI002595EAD2|nr:hypothetical protein [uncultured Paraburkholderia sp.]CAH2895886.1 MAG: unnamed protein product [uncultured Paraburkholderia sp.]CAH2919028.1 MAG: unnamed protein product [uncultured Paraburkholderia sp.]
MTTESGAHLIGAASAHAQPGHTGELVAGSLTWQIEQLALGEALYKSGGNETARRNSQRAIANVISRHSERECDLDLWLALHHSSTGEGVRLYRTRRVR